MEGFSCYKKEKQQLPFLPASLRLEQQYTLSGWLACSYWSIWMQYTSLSNHLSSCYLFFSHIKNFSRYVIKMESSIMSNLVTPEATRPMQSQWQWPICCCHRAPRQQAFIYPSSAKMPLTAFSHSSGLPPAKLTTKNIHNQTQVFGHTVTLTHIQWMKSLTFAICNSFFETEHCSKHSCDSDTCWFEMELSWWLINVWDV